MSAWLGRWGFGLLVLLIAVAAGSAAFSAAVPGEIPDYALGSATVYRTEVGAAVFTALYVAAMALVLALNNRAFTELGRGGVSARDVVRSEDRANVRELEKTAESMLELIADKASRREG